MAAKLNAPIRRLAYTPAEAAAALGVGIDHFNEHLRPHLRVVRVGRKVLYPVGELEKWLADRAEAPVRSRD